MKKTLFKIFKYMGNFHLVVLALILAAVAAVMTIIGPDKVGEITDLMSDGLMGNIDMSAIANVGFTLITIYLISAISNFVQHYIMATVTLKASKRMRHDLSVKINKVPQKQFKSNSTGDILSRITNDVSVLQQGMTNSLPTIISAATQFMGCLIMMFTTEWHLALVSVFITLIGMVIIAAIMGKSQKYFSARQLSLGELNGYIEEMYSGHDVVRISRAEEKVLKRFSKLNEKVYDANWKSQFLSGMMQPLMNVVGNLAFVAVCVIGAGLAMNGTIKFGVIVSFILYVRLFTSPLTQIAQGMTNLQTATAGANRIFDFMEAEELEDESHKPKHNVDDTIGAVEFENVRFAYPENPDNIIIKNFSVKIKSGQKVAIVGPTGAGKTTLVNLLMRFFEINGGRITVDGRSITDIRREDVHNMFGMVLQDTWLFEGTVRENLVYNMKNITDQDIMKVAKVCGIDKFIRALPNGLDTVLSEQTSISAGQKQLFTIARAMLQDAPMLILDEATSSVDTRTELIIQKAMDELTKNRTSFVIAHRLSTIRNADLILVMNEGDVIESGNHVELMKKGGFYYQLYQSQFENNQSQTSCFDKKKILEHLNVKDMPLYLYDCIDSTNNEAKRHTHGENKYALYIADKQTDGRGRLGRSFYSPEKTGLYMSFVYKTDMRAIENPMLITLKAAMAVNKALEKLSGLSFGVKWVNDIYLGNRKVCGILAEGIVDKNTGILSHVAVGIGINVNTSEFPEDIAGKAGSLNMNIDRDILAAEIINEILPLYENMEDVSFLEEYRRKSIVIGKTVEFEHENAQMTGKAVGISDSGALIVKTKEDMEYTISSGIVEMNFD